MKVSSKSFENNELIPKKHTGFGEDLSPEFQISDVPAYCGAERPVLRSKTAAFRD